MSAFLVCGLCSQVVDESMTIDDADGSRSFLTHILSVKGRDIPDRVCADCFQETAECKEFADRCGRAIAKLKNRGISDHMILGKSPADKKLMRDIMAKSTDEFSPPRKKKELGASDFTLDRRPRLLPSPKNQPKVIIGSISQRTARDGNGFEDHDEETTDEEEGFVDETPLQQMSHTAVSRAKPKSGTKSAKTARSRLGTPPAQPQKSRKRDRGDTGTRDVVDTDEEDDDPFKVAEPTGSSMRECRDILKELFSKKHTGYAWPFYKPVDTSIFKDYRNYVKNPMDLETIDNKLDEGEYDDPGEFASDMRLMFKNCHKYNNPGDDVVVMADKLRAVFESRFAKISGENPEMVSSYGRVRKRKMSQEDFLEESDEDDLLGSSLLKPGTSPLKQRANERSRRENPSYDDSDDDDDFEDDEYPAPLKQRRPTSAKPGSRNGKAKVRSRVPGPGSRTARDGNGFDDHEEETSDEEEGFMDETPLKQRSHTAVSRAKPKSGPKGAKTTARMSGPGSKKTNNKADSDSESDSADSDEEEAFPAEGPFQCEICQEVNDQKVDFVRHIKVRHSDEVDDSVVESLERDLRIRRKKEKKVRATLKNWRK